MPEAPKHDTIPEEHRKALKFIEDVTINADEVQRRVLSEILKQNSNTEYLRRHGLKAGADSAAAAFKRRMPVVTYEDLQPDIHRIANGDRSPILCGRPISEFLTSSGTSGGERKLMPTISDELNRRSLLYSLLMPVMNHPCRGWTRGKEFALRARPEHGGAPRGAVFASGFIRAIRFLEKHWQSLARDIRTGTLDPEITDRSVREAVMRVLKPNARLADFIESECGRDSWQRIIPRLWPNTRYVDVIVTGAMSQYIPTLDFYSGGLPLACTMYASSECYFGLNLNPMNKTQRGLLHPHPHHGLPEFLPLYRSGTTEPDHRDLVDLVNVKLGQEYELVVTTYAGLYRYRVGDVLRVAGFKNKAPQFTFVRRKNVALSIDSDKTDEVELHAAVRNAVNHLDPFGATLFEYTSYADTSTIPGHYVLYWELRLGGTAIPPSVFEDCCLAVEESLNSVYRQGRAADGSTGPLELKIVEEGTSDKLMDYALSQGAPINQYKAPRCVKAAPVVWRAPERQGSVQLLQPQVSEMDPWAQAMEHRELVKGSWRNWRCSFLIIIMNTFIN
ncbi:hypothetical protein J5N97_000592 [Dioscorea zingiberensis]|uniref:Uncharacterized protein n=1 Tax=Dioscorea zingiberensis TaxID=325984 RepID=A0A9D5H1G1_9LILI|nr:hypothetical protein J5N97_000592 [Dioscorea zingiberensis]